MNAPLSTRTVRDVFDFCPTRNIAIALDGQNVFVYHVGACVCQFRHSGTSAKTAKLKYALEAPLATQVGKLPPVIN